jgi:hypothetical protein
MIPAEKDERVELPQLVSWFEEAERLTDSERRQQDIDEDYYHNKQHTSQEKAELRRRKQPVVAYNLIKPSVDYMAGIEKQQRVDPVARPRTPQHQQAAYAATQALHFVCKNQNYDRVRSLVWKGMLRPGIAGVKVDVETRGGELEVFYRPFAYDRFFRDAHASQTDLSDARFMGLVAWMDLNQAVAEFGEEHREALEASVRAHDNDQHYDDKPRWSVWGDSKRERVRIVEMAYLNNGVWHEAIYTKGGVIVNRPSPFHDEHGEPDNPFIAQAAYIDRDNNIYGQVREMRDPQDEVNKRRSKALHILNSRQVIADKGAVDDPNKARNELAKPDAFIEKNSGMDFDINANVGLEQGQFQLMQQSMDFLSKNDLKTAMIGGSSQSGRSKQSQQQAAFVEVGDLLDGLRDFDTRVFRATWARIKQVWTTERWVRITDDPNNIQHLGLNVPLRGPLGNVVSVQNPVAEMDVDIIIEDAPDVVSLANEEFETFMNILPTLAQLPPQWARLSVEMAPNFRDKERVLKLLDEMSQQQQPQVDPMQQEMMRLEVAGKAADVDKTQVETRKTESEIVKNLADARATVPERVPVPVPVAANQGF